MRALALTGEEMLAWNEHTTAGWRKLVTEQPEILTLPCDIYTAKTVGELLQHIVALEQRYAERIAGVAETPYEQVKFGSAEEIYATHDRAVEMLRAMLADAEFDWEKALEFQTISSGRLRSTRRTVFFHALLHATRHYAQLATLVRQHGVKPGFMMDYLIMGAERV